MCARSASRRRSAIGAGDRSLKVAGTVVHTDIEGPFHPGVTCRGTKYFQVFVNEASRGKHVAGLKTRNAATIATATYIDEMAREAMTTKCVRGDGAGQLGRFVDSNGYWTIAESSGAPHRRGRPRATESPIEQSGS